MAAKVLQEMDMLERIIERGRGALSVRTVCSVESSGKCLPVYGIAVGANGPDIPVVGFFGGIHGLENIGTQVVLAYLNSLVERLTWDATLHEQLASVRLVFMPLVNPGGMARRTRCNPRGVDLMRNAPVQSEQKVPFLLGGQRLSRHLPWYRGEAVMEAESSALCRFVGDELSGRRFSIALDCHSGFGLRDRIWFPYACSKTPIPHLPELSALHELFCRSYPHHDYIFEPQSRQYMTHGDLWDHLYLQSQHRDADEVFLPLTLEMGSWRWIRKYPMQLLSKSGFFNPLPAHRLQRVLRRHLVWLEFLTLAARGWQQWLPVGGARSAFAMRAHGRWYAGHGGNGGVGEAGA